MFMGIANPVSPVRLWVAPPNNQVLTADPIPLKISETLIFSISVFPNCSHFTFQSLIRKNICSDRLPQTGHANTFHRQTYFQAIVASRNL